MDPAFKFPPSPGTPLRSLSPERVNGLRENPQPASLTEKPLPPSPSLPPFRGFADGHHRTGSDAHVLGMVARFNSLDIKDHRAREEAAFKRMEMAREMADMELKKVKEEKREMDGIAGKYREEARRLRKEVEEGRERERKVAKRLDAVMDDLHRSKDTSTQSQGVYEKEIRRARKEAFKSSSALVKVQEELKATRNSLRITQSGLETERMKLARREQEAFTAQYQLVSVQEELEKTRAKVQMIEAERDAMRARLSAEEVARMAAEGGIPLPDSPNEEEEDELSSPRKSPRKHVRGNSEDKENVVPPKAMALRALQEELEREIARRVKFEEQVDFMKMECQFRCCSCRIADTQNTLYVHDRTLHGEMERIKATVPGLTDSASEDEDAQEEMEDIETPINEQKDAPTQKMQETATESDEVQTPVLPQEDERVHIKTEPEDEQLLDEIEMHDAVQDANNEPQPDDQPAPTREPLHPLKHQLSRITEATLEPSPAHLRAPPTSDPSKPQSPTPVPRKPVLHRVPTSEDKENLPSTSPPLSPTQDLKFLPSTPHLAPPTFRTISHTTTIPLQFSPLPIPKSDLPPTPSTISHLPAHRSISTPSIPSSMNSSHENITLDLGNIEIDRKAALEAIRQRRGRARSIANGVGTPRKGVVGGGGGGGIGERRDVSAPVPGGRYGRGV